MDDPEAAMTLHRHSLVIPVADEPRNLTLPVVLRTVKAHAPWLMPVLVGDPIGLPSYLEDFPNGQVLPFIQQHPNNPVGSTTRMLRAAIESDLVTDPFVWSNDDIYFREPVTLDDVYTAGATANGRLQDFAKVGRYGMLAHSTLLLLQSPEIARPTWNYERHVPLVVNKVDMLSALTRAPGGNPRSLYQNIALDEPAFVKADVKAFYEDDFEHLPRGKFFSTGNRFPIEAILRELALE